MKNTGVIIIGAGASGLMCAIEAGKRKRRVIVLDHSDRPGKKILMSGGGRCNFTNYGISHNGYISHNPDFCKSALSRYTQWNFLDLVHKHRISFHERKHGQLFCDNSSRDILDMLIAECGEAGVSFMMNTRIEKIECNNDSSFSITTNKGILPCKTLVVATGGLSIPASGSSPFGYRIAEQFGIKVWPAGAGLVPFTLRPEDKEKLSPLSGMAVDCIVYNKEMNFRENVLFTHRGLSGPAILQISSYWQPGETIKINFLPDMNLSEQMKITQKNRPNLKIKTLLSEYLPKRLVTAIVNNNMAEKPIQEISRKNFTEIAAMIHEWTVKPNGTEGYRTAEVTTGGVDCNAISSKTMECMTCPGLYFTGEVLDVTGWLGGYNLQWAWSSGWCAGQCC